MSAKLKTRYRRAIRISGILKTKRFLKKSDADAWYANMRAMRDKVRAGGEMPFEPRKIENFCADFIAGREHLATNGQDSSRVRLYVLPEFLGRDLHTVSRKEWKDFFRLLMTKHGLSGGTSNNIRVLIHRIYEEAKRDEPPAVLNNPISDIDPIKVVKKEMEFFRTTEECAEYLEHAAKCESSFWMAAMIALNTGMREGEIVALQWKDVDYKAATLRVTKTWSHILRKVVQRTKGKKERILGINPALSRAFAVHQAKTPFNKPSDYIVTLEDGRPMPGDSILTRHNTLIASAKLRKIRFHDLRHTFATQFLTNGGSVWDLKNILGHASITTTERYVHMLTAKMQQKASVFQVEAPSLSVMPH